MPIYRSISTLIKELDSISVIKIRELMFNTIQYRDGKLIIAAIDEINGVVPSAKSMAPGINPGIGSGMGSGMDSGMSSGMSPLNPQVFNPHPGVQIVSPSHAFFDDELPPVEEPFLPE